MPKSRIHMIVHGRVQGVFFRANAQKQARKLNITGLVKNTPDRCVEIIAEGEETALKKLAVWCSKGPLLSRIDNVETSWEKYTGEFETFSIRY
ncbi:acylphosphatase [Candidatus Woesearchaeota archaeon]|nr:acylphosphatase [Candidatus Woesearchaeota archaeon]